MCCLWSAAVTLSAGDLFSVAGKTAFVTGATGYLGQVICRVLKENGARVIGTGAMLRLAIDNAIDEYFELDANDSWANTGEKLREVAQNNQIDILINNAHPMKRESGFNVEIDQVEHPVTILNTNTTSLEIVPLPKNESRCRYCNTMAFEDER